MQRSTNIPACRDTLPRPSSRRWRSLVAALILCATAFLPVQPAAAQTVAPETVVVTIGDEPIQFATVISAIQGQFAGRDIPQSALPELVARMLDAIVRQELVVRYIKATDTEVTEAELGELLGTIKGQIAESGITYEQFLKERNMTDAKLREQLSSDIMWKKFSAERISDEAVQAYFDEHHAEFDGSEVRLGHILIRPVSGIEGGQEEAVEKANRIRRQLAQGAINFADAAARNSDAPSRRDGGDLGYMKRDAPWDEKFMEEAFALAEGDLSEVVTTPHGVHLIYCRKIRRGFKTFASTREQVEIAAITDLRQTIVDEERARTPVVFTGAVPYIDLDTDETVNPKAKPPADTPAKPADDTP